MSTVDLNDNAKNWLDGHLENIRNKILGKATSLFSVDPTLDSEMAVAKAAELYAPGLEIATSTKESFWERIANTISGVTLISGALALLFGILSYVDNWTDSKNAENLIDIAKIFAGAVVGSVGASAINPARVKS